MRFINFFNHPLLVTNAVYFSGSGFISSYIDEEYLVGHVPIEISSLLYHFLQEDKRNSIIVTVLGKIIREVGLVIPATFIAHTEKKKNSRSIRYRTSKKT